MAIVNGIFHVALLLAMPPLLLGVINKVKAVAAGRTGPPVLQAYWDLWKLVNKDTVVSRTTTWMFWAGPMVTLIAVLLAGLMVPIGPWPAPINFKGNLILLAYLFALGRFFTASAAMDTGSAFEGMGAAREVTYACFAEPAMFFALLALAKLSHSLSMSDMLGPGLGHTWVVAGPTLVLIVFSLFIVLLAENCRIPFDDPNTHLELTMIHEVMVLDHSGPAFGVVLYGASMKLFVMGAILVRLVVPMHTRLAPLDWVGFVAGMLLVAVGVGVVESMMARLRLLRIPNLLVGACLLSGFGFLLVMR